MAKSIYLSVILFLACFIQLNAEVNNSRMLNLKILCICQYLRILHCCDQVPCIKSDAFVRKFQSIRVMGD